MSVLALNSVLAIDSTPEKPAKIAAVEWLRVFACIGIVWFHLGIRGAIIGYAGLPTFMILSVAFSASRPSRFPLGATIIRRLRRLMLPWAFWSVIYALARVVEFTRLGNSPFGWMHERMMIVGTSNHLWYLPFAFVVDCVVASLVWYQPSLVQERARCVWTIVTPGMLLISSYCVMILQAPMAQWAFVMPCVPIGLAFAASGDEKKASSLTILWFTVAAAEATAAILGFPNLIIPFILGTVACALAWISPFKAGSFTLSVSSLSMGVYLVHPLVASALKRTMAAQGDLESVLTVSFISLVVCWIIQRTPLRVFI